MALPMPPPPVLLTGALNPVELFISGFNTNTYFIGLMMLLLNLGGRHLAGGLTPEQDKIFQHPWIRRALLFVVIFVATRNMFTAIWMSVGIILIIGYLTNETSDLYLFGKPTVVEQSAQPLSTEEHDLYKRLTERVNKADAEKNKTRTEGFNQASVIGNYQNTMRVIQGVT